jgi:hypothetical protein
MSDHLWPALREQLKILVTGKTITPTALGKLVMPDATDATAYITVWRWLRGNGKFPAEPKAESTLRLQRFAMTAQEKCPCCGRKIDSHFTP